MISLQSMTRNVRLEVFLNRGWKMLLMAFQEGPGSDSLNQAASRLVGSQHCCMRQRGDQFLTEVQYDCTLSQCHG